MEHQLVQSIEKALSWDSAAPMGHEFARGALPDTALCNRLLTPTRLLDIVMRRVLAPPQIRCLRDGIDVHPEAFVLPQVTRRGQSLSLINMDRLGRLIQAGCTLVLDAVDLFDATMEVACRALQWWSSELVQVNTYLTTGSAAGFDLHWDDHDVIVVQLAGEKSWEVRGQRRIAPLYRDAEPNSEPSADIVWSGTMQTGDVMHIPRGYWHQATRTDCGDCGYSLHVTFGFMKRTGIDWLSWLADHARESEAFRHDLDRCGGFNAQVTQELALHAELAALLRSYRPDTYLAARAQEHPPHRHVATWGVFGPPSRVVCVTDLPPTIEQQDETVRVVAAGKRLTFAVRAEPALQSLLSGQPVDLIDATHATDVDVAAIATALMKEGICAELTAALSSGYTGLVTDASSLSMR
jgi:hypothetical protein